MDNIIYFRKCKFSIDQFGDLSIILPPSEENPEGSVLKVSFLELFKASMHALRNVEKSNEDIFSKLQVPPSAIKEIEKAMLSQEVPDKGASVMPASKAASPPPPKTDRVKGHSALVKNILDFVKTYVQNTDSPSVFPLMEFNRLPEAEKLSLAEIGRILSSEEQFKVKIDRGKKEIIVIKL